MPNHMHCAHDRPHLCNSMASSGSLSPASSPAVEADISLLSSSEEETEESQSPEQSLLDVLKAPRPSVLARKRRVRCNPPLGVKKSKGLTLKSDPKNISPNYFQIKASG